MYAGKTLKQVCLYSFKRRQKEELKKIQNGTSWNSCCKVYILRNVIWNETNTTCQSTFSVSHGDFYFNQGKCIYTFKSLFESSNGLVIFSEFGWTSYPYLLSFYDLEPLIRTATLCLKGSSKLFLVLKCSWRLNVSSLSDNTHKKTRKTNKATPKWDFMCWTPTFL